MKAKIKAGKGDAAVSQFLDMERQNARRKSALQTLSRLFGREVSLGDPGRPGRRSGGGWYKQAPQP